MPKDVLDRIGMRRVTIAQAMTDGDLTVIGDASRLTASFGMLDSFSADFNIVTPAELPRVCADERQAGAER